MNFRDDLPLIRDFMGRRVREEFERNQPISGIEVGFRLCQAGLLIVHFDTRATHERDGEWTMALDEEPMLELPLRY